VEIEKLWSKEKVRSAEVTDEEKEVLLPTGQFSAGTHSASLDVAFGTATIHRHVVVSQR